MEQRRLQTGREESLEQFCSLCGLIRIRHLSASCLGVGTPRAICFADHAPRLGEAPLAVLDHHGAAAFQVQHFRPSPLLACRVGLASTVCFGNEVCDPTKFPARSG